MLWFDTQPGEFRVARGLHGGRVVSQGHAHHVPSDVIIPSQPCEGSIAAEDAGISGKGHEFKPGN